MNAKIIQYYYSFSPFSLFPKWELVGHKASFNFLEIKDSYKRMLSIFGRNSQRICASAAIRTFSAAPATKNGKVVVVSSGKGGVGKTTTAASFAMGLADRGFKVVAIDFDIGLRNLDIHLGCERRVIFDFVHVLQKECTLSQALIKDKRNGNLNVLAASQTKDKDVLKVAAVGELFEELKKNFEYVSS